MNGQGFSKPSGIISQLLERAVQERIGVMRFDATILKPDKGRAQRPQPRTCQSRLDNLQA